MQNKPLKKIAVFTGAGISAESGIQTFRGPSGLWEGHRIEDVASPEGWAKDSELVLHFYNQRRQQLLQVQPNAAHTALKELESQYHVSIITQNVDDLHERAGSTHIIHLHGELLKARSTQYEHLVYPCTKDIQLGDTCEKGAQLRPHIVWFGEAVPLLQYAAKEILDAQAIIIIGTSLAVYPAASLISYAPPKTPIYYIDPNPADSVELYTSKQLTVIPEKATIGVPKLVQQLNAQAKHA